VLPGVLPFSDAQPGTPAPRVRFGTSSFSSEDWVGPFYPPGAKPRDFLRFYAREFDTVEVDATYYAVPAPRVVSGWVEKTPPGFVVSAKFPRGIVHCGEGATPDASRVLVPDATYAERDAFLAAMDLLGERRGPLVLQFPWFDRRAFPEAGPFLARLDRFLGDLPAGPAYAVEVRNAEWVGEPLREVLARRGAAMVVVDQAGMPHGDEVRERLDPVTAGFAYVRLLGDRREIEAVTRTWDREVFDRSDRMRRWARFLAGLAADGVRTWVYVNNHYAGHAPTTTRRLRAMFEEEVARRASPAP
jgi:uncharacterized protein YecE (DUF72 family)